MADAWRHLSGRGLPLRMRRVLRDGICRQKVCITNIEVKNRFLDHWCSYLALYAFSSRICVLSRHIGISEYFELRLVI